MAKPTAEDLRVAHELITEHYIPDNMGRLRSAIASMRASEREKYQTQIQQLRDEIEGMRAALNS